MIYCCVWFARDKLGYLKAAVLLIWAFILVHHIYCFHLQQVVNDVASLFRQDCAVVNNAAADDDLYCCSQQEFVLLQSHSNRCRCHRLVLILLRRRLMAFRLILFGAY